jgi:hypothetical protein
MMILKKVFVCLLIFGPVTGNCFAAGTGHARSESRLFVPFGLQENLLRPETKEEVLRAYAWRVNPDDGVSRQEALLIAQHEVVLKEFYDDYRFADPWIVSEDTDQWTVRIPAKFSLTHETSNYFVCVNKTSGKITCSEKR